MHGRASRIEEVSPEDGDPIFPSVFAPDIQNITHIACQ